MVCLPQLPVELLANVLRYSDTDSVFCLSLTSSSLHRQVLACVEHWNELVKQQCGIDYMLMNPFYAREALWHFYHPRKYAAAADDCAILWGSDTRYWRVVCERDSDLGQVLQMCTAYRLDVRASFAVPHGVWVATARVRSAGFARGVRLAYMEAWCEIDGAARNKVRVGMPRLPKDEFVVIRLPMPIHAHSARGVSTVHVRIHDTIGSCKRGWMIDYLELQPLSTYGKLCPSIVADILPHQAAQTRRYHKLPLRQPLHRHHIREPAGSSDEDASDWSESSQDSGITSDM
ncbi:hypothetical protein RI367_006146 [Sorochytrium milnesiophthora]